MRWAAVWSWPWPAICASPARTRAWASRRSISDWSRVSGVRSGCRACAGAALELCLLGAPVDAARAQALGLLTRVVEPEQLDAEVERVAQQLARSAPIALRHILASVIEGGECALDQALLLEQQAFALCFASADMREGTRAFIEKRKPRFTGR